jgi:hypothetical protein
MNTGRSEKSFDVEACSFDAVFVGPGLAAFRGKPG